MILKRLLLALALLGVLAAMFFWAAMTWSYSSGERAGWVQKLSHKGWLCKTWEGEVAMVTMPGAIPDRFEFSVRDEAVAAKINAMAGQRIVLIYSQHKFVPTKCFGETEYFVTDARAVNEQPVSTAPAVAPPLTPPVAAPALAAPAK